MFQRLVSRGLSGTRGSVGRGAALPRHRPSPTCPNYLALSHVIRRPPSQIREPHRSLAWPPPATSACVWWPELFDFASLLLGTMAHIKAAAINQRSGVMTLNVSCPASLSVRHFMCACVCVCAPPTFVHNLIHICMRTRFSVRANATVQSPSRV